MNLLPFPLRRTRTEPPRGITVACLAVLGDELQSARTYTGSDPSLIASMLVGGLRRDGVDDYGEFGDAVHTVLSHTFGRMDMDDQHLPVLPHLTFPLDAFHLPDPDDDEPDTEPVQRMSIAISAGQESWTGYRGAVEVTTASTSTDGPYTIGQPVDLTDDETGNEYVAHVITQGIEPGQFFAFAEKRDLLICVEAPPTSAHLHPRRLVRRGGRKGAAVFGRFFDPPTLDADLDLITAA